MKKVCTKCNTEKPFTAFQKRSRATDGLKSACKLCRNAQSADRYWGDRERRPIVPEGSKYCPFCETIKATDSFHKNKSRYDGLQGLCGDCNTSTSGRSYEKYKVNYKQVQKQWRAANKPRNAAAEAKRRASKLNRTPMWSDLEKIQKIYMDCPVGHHVDHIVPLQGITVSGLHVPDNLQYLLARDNMSKSNKFRSI